MPACRSGWEWRPAAAPPDAVHDGPMPEPVAGPGHAEYEPEAGS